VLERVLKRTAMCVQDLEHASQQPTLRKQLFCSMASDVHQLALSPQRLKSRCPGHHVV